MPPPPEPIFPDQFAIQLYNPDTQIIVKEQKSKWSGTQSWEFSIPQVTFRTPSASTLDRTQNDPAADATTPRVNFVWRKEGRYGKDMTCYLTGKSTDLAGKKAKKSKEPDIAVALFTMLKEMTIMEPNLYRIEIEDYKGLEVVLLLSAAVIRDLFINSQREAFHIVDPVGRKNSGGILTRKASSPLVGPGVTQPMMTPQPPPPPPYSGPSQYPPEKVGQPSTTAAQPAAAPTTSSPASFANRLAQRSSLPPLQTQSHSQQAPPRREQHRPSQPQQPTSRPQQPPRMQQNPAQPQRMAQRTAQRQQQPTQVPPQQPPRLDPRAQWEIDAETARLKAAVEAEAREQKKQEEAARKARRRAEQEEERKTMQFLENERKTKEREEKERRRKQAEIDKETERLRKQFGDQSNLLGAQRPSPQTQRHSVPHIQFQTQRPGPSRPQQRPAPVPTQPTFTAGPYLQPGGHRPGASASSFFSNGLPKPQAGQAPMKAKKSFWGLRSNSETNAEKLKKKKSSMF